MKHSAISLILGSLLLALAALHAAESHAADSAEVGYVFASFTAGGQDGLHLLSSLDGKTWRSVKNYASIYEPNSGIMRDPSICRGGDGNYHMVWTSEWFNDNIGIAHSDDLIHWTPMENLYLWADYRGQGDEESDGTRWAKDITQPARHAAKVRNCWAPEIFYEDQTKEYVICWTTGIDDPTVFPKTWDARAWKRLNHRIYYVTTKDFKTYTPRKFFYAPADRVVIDAFVCKVAPGQYRLLVKDEKEQRLYVCASTKPFTTWANMPRDFWSPMSDQAFVGRGIGDFPFNAEGPCAIQVGSEWLVYCDYWSKGKNGLFSTTDFNTMKCITNELHFPTWVRHGTALKVPKAAVNLLSPPDQTIETTYPSPDQKPESFPSTKEGN